MSTLCAGCGHDSITAAIVRAFYELDDAAAHDRQALRHRLLVEDADLLRRRRARLQLGARPHAGHRDRRQRRQPRSLTYIGITGDGDSLSIGLGQLVHAIRRNVNMLYVIENNGVYGLTKGQFSASADIGSKSKRGEANRTAPIDPVMLALELGATFVARSFSGDKAQLVPILKAGLSHKGFALVDVISPCVTFNDHEGSTKSYLYTRKRMLPMISTDFAAADFVPPAAEITAEYAPGSAVSVKLHDGSIVRLRKLAEDYDTGDRQAAADEVERHRSKGEVPTGLFFVDTKSRDMHDISGTTDVPLSQLPFEKLCPGSAALDELQKSFR